MSMLVLTGSGALLMGLLLARVAGVRIAMDRIMQAAMLFGVLFVATSVVSAVEIFGLMDDETMVHAVMLFGGGLFIGVVMMRHAL